MDIPSVWPQHMYSHLLDCTLVPWFPFSLSMGDLGYVNGIHVTSMTGNQTVDYYVRPWHFYSHSRTCTRSRLCRRASRLVAFHATSVIVPMFMRFHLSWLDSTVCQISSATMDILIHCMSSAFMEILILDVDPSHLSLGLPYASRSLKFDLQLPHWITI